MRARKKVIIKKNVKIGKNTQFEGDNLLSRNVSICDSSLGYASYLGEDCDIQSCEIGRFSSIGPRVRTIVGKHPSSKFVSTHPVFYSQQKQIGDTFVKQQKFEEYCPKDSKGHSIHIGSDVWIGADVLIMDGITIGNGAIIAAGTLVNKNVPDYAIYGGVPGKIIRYRFEKEQIQKLQEICWWNQSIKWIKSNAEEFEDIDEFLRQFKGSVNE